MGKTNAIWRKTWLCHVVIGIMLTAPISQAAVESTTESFVAVAQAIQGSGPSQGEWTYLSAPLVAPIAAAGVVTALGADMLQDTNAQWSAAQFAATGGLYYVEFDDGYMLDVVQVNADTRTLTLAASPPNTVAVGDAYRIRQHLTLRTVLGNETTLVLQAGPNPSAADLVRLLDPQTQHKQDFFFSNVTNFTGWYRDDYTAADEQVVFPGQGLMIFRKATEDTVLYMHGVSKDFPTLVPVFPGDNLVGTMQAATALKLPELNLYTGDPTGFAALADKVVLVPPGSVNPIFFNYVDLPGYAGWYYSGDNPANDFYVPPGSAFRILRKSSSGMFFWSIPPE